MAGGAFWRIARARGDAVARAIGGMAQKAAAFDDAISSHGRRMGLAGFGEGFEAQQIGGPIPNIACHAIKPVAIGSKGAGGAGESKAIGGGVLVGKGALPDIAGQMLAIIGRRIAPRIGHISQTATGGMLPFCFPRKTSPRPGAIGLRIRPR